MKYTTIGSGAAARRVSALCLGAMKLGGTVDEATSRAVLDRFAAAGGNFIDTANNYQFWEDGCTPDDSELQVGRWLSGVGADAARDLVVATKFGARPTVDGGGPAHWEGLSAATARAAAEGSLKRLGVDRLDLYYTHVEDRSVPLSDTLHGLAGLVGEGRVGLLGASNHRAWRLERARGVSEAHDLPRYEVLQLRYSYLQPRFDVPFPELGHVHATDEHMDFVREENAAGRPTALVTYTPLLYGAYTRPDRRLSAPYDHPGTQVRLAALDRVAREVDATRNQVVLAWLMGHDPPIIPLVGVSTVAQVDEAVAATELTLTPDQRRELNEAR